MRTAFEHLETQSAAKLVNRMERQADGDFMDTDSLDQKLLSDYRTNVGETMKKRSNANEGYIVWLRCDELPPLETIKAKKILPNGKLAIIYTLYH